MQVKDWMELVGYRITEGSPYEWACFGHNAYCLDSWDSNNDGQSASIIFDTNSQTVYTIAVYDYGKNLAYRWTNPDWIEKYTQEANSRCPNPHQAWDEVDYIELEVEEDFLEKATDRKSVV